MIYVMKKKQMQVFDVELLCILAETETVFVLLWELQRGPQDTNVSGVQCELI